MRRSVETCNHMKLRKYMIVSEAKDISTRIEETMEGSF